MLSADCANNCRSCRCSHCASQGKAPFGVWLYCVAGHSDIGFFRPSGARGQLHPRLRTCNRNGGWTCHAPAVGGRDSGQVSSGALSPTNAASYWSAGNVVLLRSDLPRFLRTGLFAPSGDPNYGPEISIHTNNGFAGDCIALCWYDHGLLVGSPQFRCDWKTYYLKQLKPGIYSYYVGK